MKPKPEIDMGGLCLQGLRKKAAMGFAKANTVHLLAVSCMTLSDKRVVVDVYYDRDRVRGIARKAASNVSGKSVSGPITAIVSKES